MLLMPMLVFAWDEVNREISIHCSQQSHDAIDCDYRLVRSRKIPEITASLDDVELPIIKQSSYPYGNSKTAILFLVDTSDPGRQDVINKNIQQIRLMLSKLDTGDVAGLGSFDKEFELLAELGSSSDAIRRSLESLKAKGRTTELYRNIRSAILHLANVDADRKAIILFSDGQAEDKAYFHRDVVRAATDNNVIINAIGFPRSTPLSVALQTIRRLSEETGGRYIESTAAYDLPEQFIQAPFDNLRGGGQFAIDLSLLDRKTSTLSSALNLRFILPGQAITLQLPIKKPPVKNTQFTPGPEQTEQILEELIQQRLQQVTDKVSEDISKLQEVAAENALPAPQPTIRVVEKANGNQFSNQGWLIYTIPMILLVILLITIIVLVFTLLRGQRKASISGVMQTFKPYAYLIQNDDINRLFPITSTTWRIGRSKDNEMSFNDHSISRRHAEIHRSQGDEFNIIDLDSMNGVFVNSDKVKFQILKDGDIIDIGDLSFRFSLFGPDHIKDEKTSLQKTQSPDLSFE